MRLSSLILGVKIGGKGGEYLWNALMLYIYKHIKSWSSGLWCHIMVWQDTIVLEDLNASTFTSLPEGGGSMVFWNTDHHFENLRSHINILFYNTLCNCVTVLHRWGILVSGSKVECCTKWRNCNYLLWTKIDLPSMWTSVHLHSNVTTIQWK